MTILFAWRCHTIIRARKTEKLEILPQSCTNWHHRLLKSTTDNFLIGRETSGIDKKKQHNYNKLAIHDVGISYNTPCAIITSTHTPAYVMYPY
jgi:tRNA(Leu) C34 or U34 (ribose-2'-O)-methylase TrmL